MTDDDLTLFGIAEEQRPREPVTLPIRPDQVEQIRLAFEEAGIASQSERKTLVDAAAMRDVPSLRDLTAVEGHRVQSWLKRRQAAKPQSGGSAWDMREEDTWIDKL